MPYTGAARARARLARSLQVRNLCETTTCTCVLARTVRLTCPCWPYPVALGTPCSNVHRTVAGSGHTGPIGHYSDFLADFWLQRPYNFRKRSFAASPGFSHRLDFVEVRCPVDHGPALCEMIQSVGLFVVPGPPTSKLQHESFELIASHGPWRRFTGISCSALKAVVRVRPCP